MFSYLCHNILKLTGWRIDGEYPRELRKKILIVAPHTSYWDFILGLLVKWSLGIKHVHYLGKKSLFKAPYGWFFRSLGGIPVDRSRKGQLVSKLTETIRSRNAFTLVLAPEGTRKRVDRFKTGFYYIATEGGIPIIMVRFDYGNKVVSFSKPFYPTGDKESDINQIESYFRGIRGKLPEKSFV